MLGSAEEDLGCRGGAWLPYWDSEKGGGLSKANGQEAGPPRAAGGMTHPKIRLCSIKRRQSWDPQAHFKVAVYEVCVLLDLTDVPVKPLVHLSWFLSQ